VVSEPVLSFLESSFDWFSLHSWQHALTLRFSGRTSVSCPFLVRSLLFVVKFKLIFINDSGSGATQTLNFVQDLADVSISPRTNNALAQ
jgi:hypothetical protein